MAGNGRFPHFHPHSSGWGYVEHERHVGLPDRPHRHVDDPRLMPSIDEEPMPPGMAERPKMPTPAKQPRRLWTPGGVTIRRRPS